MHLRALHRLRGVAALYVVIVHACTLLWSYPSEGPLGAILTSVLAFPHQAVLLFFVVSGFCIHQRQAILGTHRIDLRTFAFRRIKRLWPPLTLALVLTALFDTVGATLDPGLYAPLHLSRSAETFLGNLLMQSQLAAPIYGTNVPLWSLAVEFWLYALYPVLLVIFARLDLRRSLVLVAAISIVSQWLKQSLAFWPLDITSAWAVWSVGALLAELHARGHAAPLIRRFARIGIVATAVVVAATLNPGWRDRVPDTAWGLVLALGVAFLLVSRRRLLPTWLGSAMDRLGDVSYSLYLTHFPFAVMLAALWRTSVGPIPAAPVLLLAALGLSLGLAALAWWSVERRCYAARVGVRPPVRTAARSGACGRPSAATTA